MAYREDPREIKAALVKGAGMARDFSVIQKVVGETLDLDLARGWLGKFLMSMSDGLTAGGHEQLYQAMAAAPRSPDIFKAHVVWLAVSAASWQNIEPLFDWAKSKPEFETPSSGLLNALAEKAGNRSLARKLIDAGANISLAIDAAQTNARPTRPEALALLQDWQAAFAPPPVRKPKGFSL